MFLKKELTKDSIIVILKMKRIKTFFCLCFTNWGMFKKNSVLKKCFLNAL
ncbi:hypothetical protein BBU94A_H06 (plasmid) [Borreliella burgdorferi 94a]|nr:hypothetical protein BBU94A_H06 [Borreliella burgdorferi 94a]